MNYPNADDHQDGGLNTMTARGLSHAHTCTSWREGEVTSVTRMRMVVRERA